VMEAHSVSAGLDYPGIGPLHSYLHESKLATYMPITDEDALQSAEKLALAEGIIPALETAHAIAALYKLNFKKSDIVVVCLSGRGDKDLETYQNYFQKI
jgi:tryptophan synthase beta chain